MIDYIKSFFGGKKRLGDPENPHFGEHLHKHPLAPSAFGINPADGLPSPASVATLDITTSPPLTKETFVCMADLSKFVIRSEVGYVLIEFDPHEVERWPNGCWYLKKDMVSDEIWKKSTLAVSGNEHAPVVPVQPIRPQCANYRRTLVDMQGNPDHRSLERVCTAARDENGQFVTINDTRIHACELREPRDFETEARLDAFDEKAIAQTREETSEFDIDAALASEGGAGGIFEKSEGESSDESE